MKFLNIAKQIAALVVASAIFTSCEGPEDANEVFGGGKTIVHLINGGPTDDPGSKQYAIDFVNTPTTVVGADVRRDIPNPTELNRSMTVLIKDDTAAVTAAGYVHLDPAWYTVGNATKTGGQGGTYTLTFAPGEFAKPLNITIPDATVLDPSSTYALAFTIQTVDADGVVSANRTVLAIIGAKNPYDGRYELTWANYHPSGNPGYTGGTQEVLMITTGANTVKLFWPAAAAYANPAIIGGSLSYYGLQEPEYTVNTTTNKVTVQNAASGAVTFYTMNPLFDSHWDPVNKILYAKWGYSYVGGQFVLGTSREWTQTFRYLGPR